MKKSEIQKKNLKKEEGDEKSFIDILREREEILKKNGESLIKVKGELEAKLEEINNSILMIRGSLVEIQNLIKQFSQKDDRASDN